MRRSVKGRPDLVQDLVLGLGCARDTSGQELLDHVQAVLAAEGIDADAVACIATIDLKAGAPAIEAVARALDVPLWLFSAAELEAQTARLAHPSSAVFARIGCHGVAEGAALAAAGQQGHLIVDKRKSRTATCAVAQAPGPLGPTRSGRLI